MLPERDADGTSPALAEGHGETLSLAPPSHRPHGMVEWVGVLMVVVGLGLFAVELVHPGALLLIPGTILLVAGVLATFLSADILLSVVGVAAIVGSALVATAVQVRYYQWIAPTHRPMTTTSGGLAGEVGMVIAPVEPDTLRGKVRIKSEVWSARSDRPIPLGTKVRVVSGEGVAIQVVPLEEPSGGVPA
jgi:membrane-bound ClpP family serine protease